MNKRTLAFLGGLILALIIGRLYFVYADEASHDHSDDSHPIGYADTADEVHVHSDFVVYLDGKRIDLSDDKYQSRTGQILAEHVHLHGNNDEVIHRHDHGVTLGDFFDSLGFSLTDECISTDTGRELCTNQTKQLTLYANGVATTSITEYVPREEDSLLLYYGAPEAEIVSSLLDSVTDTACIYSGTCPERGIAPPEECGLTCEL